MNKKMQQTAVNPLPTHFNLHEDAGHGWLEVPFSALITLNIRDKISRYSYWDAEMVYLEEDLDLTIFVQAYLRYIGKSEKDYSYFLSMVDTINDGDWSPIRGYCGYYSV